MCENDKLLDSPTSKNNIGHSKTYQVHSSSISKLQTERKASGRKIKLNWTQEEVQFVLNASKQYKGNWKVIHEKYQETFKTQKNS